MIHKYNIAELSLVDRPVRGPDSGFGTVVNKHPQGHDRAYRNTAMNDGYGYNPKPDSRLAVDQFNYTQN